jgi:hypothetical protein
MNNSMIQGLGAYALPADAVSENDMAEINTRIEQVLVKISESATSSGNRMDYETIRSGLLSFQEWLRSQGCVAGVSSSYDIEDTGLYDESIFVTHPGQMPFDIVFRMAGGAEQAYRLLLFVTAYDLFNFGSLVKNNAKEEVFIPERWPEDAPAFWESRS